MVLSWRSNYSDFWAERDASVPPHPAVMTALTALRPWAGMLCNGNSADSGLAAFASQQVRVGYAAQGLFY